MTAPAAELQPWVQPYLPDFRELLRRLDLTPGFIFQPVVLPSPDLARALAAWLAAQGVDVRVFDMCHEPWDDLAARLLAVTFNNSPAAERRAVVVVTPSELDRSAVRDGFRYFNSVRDTLARDLQSPLLWCGSVDLLRVTADFATDFWSIAAPVYRISLRALSDVPSHLGFPRMWWTGAARDGTDDIAARLAAARARGDGRAAAHSGLDLAEAQLARGERSDAAETLTAIESSIHTDAPALATRWRALNDATRAANVSPGDAIAELQAQIARAHARGATRLAASLQLDLARLLRTSGRPTESFEALLAARTLFLRDGDDSAATAAESLLAVVFPDRLSPELTAEIRAHAELMAHGPSSPKTRSTAWKILAALARHQQRWDDADAAAAAVLRDLPPDDTSRMLALRIRSEVAAARGDWGAATARLSELLKSARTYGADGVALEAYHSRAIAHSALGHHRDACRDLIAARSLAARLGAHPAVALRTLDLSTAAKRIGAMEVHAALAARAFALCLGLGGTFDPNFLVHLRESGDDELAGLLAADADDPPNHKYNTTAIHALADAREQALCARGIDLWNPDTWPPPPAPPPDIPSTSP